MVEQLGNQKEPLYSHPGKRIAFRDLAISHYGAMRLLRDFGQLRQLGEPRERRAWGKLLGEERSFRNIPEHALTVLMVTDTILQQAVEKELISPQQRQQGGDASLLHDLTKRNELEKSLGIEKGQGIQMTFPERQIFIQKLIREKVTDPSWRKRLELIEWVGENAYGFDPENINLNQSPESLIKWTIFWADSVVSDTKIEEPAKRLGELVEKRKYGDLYTWWYQELYGEEKLKKVQQDVDPYAEIARTITGKHIALAQEVEKQLKTQLGIGEDESLLDFVREGIIKRYEVIEQKSQVVKINLDGVLFRLIF